MKTLGEGSSLWWPESSNTLAKTCARVTQRRVTYARERDFRAAHRPCRLKPGMR